MDIKLAPRPQNEERRVVAVKRTGVIDGEQNDNFAIFCEVAKALTGWEYVAFSLFDENFQCSDSVQHTIVVEDVLIYYVPILVLVELVWKKKYVKV